MRWRWDSELVNDRESESFSLFGGEGGCVKQEEEKRKIQHTGNDKCVVTEEKMRYTGEKRVKEMK